MRWSPRALNFTVALAVLVLFEVMFWRPAVVFWIGATSAALFTARVLLEIYSAKYRLRPAIPFLASAMLLTWSALGFSLLLERFAVRQFLALVTALDVLLLFDSMRTYILNRAEYKGYALENIVSYTLTLSIFLGGGLLYGLHGLLDISTVAVIAAFGVLVGAAGIIFFNVSAPARVSNRVAGIAIGFVALQLFAAFMALPFHFVVSGAAVTVLWYVASSMARAHILGTLTLEVARRHLALGSALLVILLISARWI